MMRSLFSAVSGLRAHQTKMDVIGNNIANVNTVAYKSQSVTFGDVYYQTTQTATGPNAETQKGGTNAQQIGLGSSVGSITTSTTEGSTERTDNPWNLSISGDSFFIVKNGGNTYFTRAGDFTVDTSGALVTSGGASVMGWYVDKDTGNVEKDEVKPLYVNSAEYKYTEPEATKGVSVTGNLNADTTEKTTFSFEFFDSLGNSYQAYMTAAYDETNSTDDIAQYTLTGGKISMNGKETSLTVESSGSLQFNAVTGAPIKDAMSSLVMTITDPDGTNSIKNIGTNASESTSTINFDATGLTMYKDTSAIKPVRGIKNEDGNYEGAGKAVGKMTSAGIDETGRIVASYSNGDTKTIGQIAVTTFSNPAGLEKVGSNLYSATLNSGLFDGIGEDISATDGKIKSGYLEMSNVDLANEFTSMITTQRGYQANSRIITVSDTLLDELINLKR